MVNKYGERYMIVQKIRDIKDANKGTAVNATSMKEGIKFEACNKEDTPINCTICNNRFESPIDLKKHMISHEDTTKVAQRKPETIEECKLCKEIRTQDRPMHICW